ncbi:unnamed protein product, partial [Tuber aestivum]
QHPTVLSYYNILTITETLPSPLPSTIPIPQTTASNNKPRKSERVPPHCNPDPRISQKTGKQERSLVPLSRFTSSIFPKHVDVKIPTSWPLPVPYVEKRRKESSPPSRFSAQLGSVICSRDALVC